MKDKRKVSNRRRASLLSGFLRSRSPSLLSWLIVNFSAMALPSERDDYLTRAGVLQSNRALESRLHRQPFPHSFSGNPGESSLDPDKTLGGDNSRER